MKYVDEFRDARRARELADRIARLATRPWTIMEICGGQTHAIMKFGIDRLLPEGIRLVHGPGCPVCVTPLEQIDRALAIARRPEVIFCSFGDMIRVPGSEGSLGRARAAGADLRVVYGPLDAVGIARENPDREVVFFAVGFETTAPVNALAVLQAAADGLKNFSLLVSHVLVPPAIAAILSADECAVQGFLAAGHVCAIMGQREYEPLAERFATPIVITGFEPVDILEGVRACVECLEAGRPEVVNAYARAVRPEGNPAARDMVERVFALKNRKWRGIGEIPASGLGLAPAYRDFDAESRFDLERIAVDEPTECISGLILQGRRRPDQCPGFGTTCTPESPLGAPMVSGEGACAAYYRYRRETAATGAGR